MYVKVKEKKQKSQEEKRNYKSPKNALKGLFLCVPRK
jgi:hypothetical protein